jgi:hypothetical protein
MDNRDTPFLNPFLAIVGEQLSAVCFVQDYLQLEFDGYKLTTYTTPMVVIGDSTCIAYNQENYKNLLCDFLAKKVRDITYAETEFVEIFFDTSTHSIKVMLNPFSDNIYYSDYEEKWFVI